MKVALRLLLSLSGLLLTAACASRQPSAARRQTEQAEPLPSTITDASYDWRVLLLEPFGVLLKESPLPLHEVLLFHDAANRGESDSKDCYSIEGTPPKFLDERPEHYLLCFDHDRLGRVEAAVRLPADEAPQVFARACALWLKDTAMAPGGGTTCEGQSGRVAFTARLTLPPGDTAATVSMTLTDTPAAEPDHDPPAAR